MPGLKYLCEESTFHKLGERLALVRPGLVFLGGSSFHHLSYHLIKRSTSRPLGVVIFDKHNDFLPAPAGHISCGSWIRELVELPNIEQVLIIGSESPEAFVQSEPLEKKAPLLPDKVRWATLRWARRELGRLFSAVSRIYISIDKDVLAEAGTDWGAGSMSLRMLLCLLREIQRAATVVGADVCGEVASLSPWPSAAELTQIRKNEDINLAICQTLLGREVAPRVTRPRNVGRLTASLSATGRQGCSSLTRV